MRKIKAVTLNSESFKDYGQVISNCQAKPITNNEEFTYWGKVAELGISEKMSSGILLARKREGIIRSLERHMRTPEILIALEGDSLICMAKPETTVGMNQIEGIQIFYIHQGEAIAMYLGTWHWIPFPVNQEETRFLVIFASGTEVQDLEVRDLEEVIMASI